MFGALLALGVMNTLGWHWYLGIATFPLFLVLFIFPFVPESARFYLMKGDHEKAKKVLQKVAWFNRKSCPEGKVVTVEEKEAKMINQEMPVSYNQERGVSFENQLPSLTVKSQEETPLLEEDEECDQETTSYSKSQLKVITCLRHLKEQIFEWQEMFTGGMWRTTVLLWILWFGCGWIYYGAVLLTTSIFQYNNHCFRENSSNETTECGDLPNKYYVRIFLTAVAELPGLIVTVIIIEVIGRKKTMALEFAITLVGFLLLFVCSTQAVTTFFLFLVRAFATGVFQAVYVYTPEVYATNIRARALGLHTSAARIGALLTPFNAQVSIWSAIMPLYTFV
jgi:MFS family permease